MVAQGRKNRRSGEHVRHLFDRLLEDLQVLLPSLVPDVVRGQVSRPHDVVDVLEGNPDWLSLTFGECRAWYLRDGSLGCAEACCPR